MAGRLVFISFLLFAFIGCSGGAENDGMNVDAPKMSAEEQQKVEGSRHDPATQEMLNNRPR